MITNKKKKCKGTGKAKGFGCSEIKYIYRYGLCKVCIANWLYNTPEGKEVLYKTVICVKKKLLKSERTRIRKKKNELLTKSDLEKQLQTIINSIVRLIDHDKGCISCIHGWDGNWTRQAHAGHRLSIGSHPVLRFNVLNNFKQCSICNNYLSGNEREYDKGLLKHYGQESVDKIEEIRIKYKELHLSKNELEEFIGIAKEVKKRIISGEDLTSDQINNYINIYK